MRRTFGHALWLLPLWSAGLAWLLGRRYRHLKYGAVFGMVLLGASVHILFDLINSFGVVLFWPFSSVRPELAMVFIIDFILTGLLALPLLFLMARPLRAHLERMSRLALLCVSLYLALCGMSRARAAGILERAAAGATPPEFTYVFPEPLGPHRWRGVVRRGTRYDVYLILAFSGTATLEETVTTETGDPRVAAARATPFGRRLGVFFKAPVWRMDGEVPTVYDLRFETLVLKRPPVFKFRIPA
jgi:hypothetical protein